MPSSPTPSTPPPPPPPHSRPDDAPAFRYTALLADELELRWQKAWNDAGAYRALNPGEPGFHPSRPKFYCLDMFPYPSGAGLHVGHPEGYTATDIICRYKRMQGFNVLHPMGWDAFGLPAEQYAIATGVHPAQTTRKAIDNFRRQLQRFGFCYDWSREFATIDEDYYRWTQWIFLQLYNSWYDAEAEGQGGTGVPPPPPVHRPEAGATKPRGRARPISELRHELESGSMGIDPFGDPVRLGERAVTLGLGGTPDGTRLWHQLSQADRRAVIDNQRLAYIDEVTVNWCPKLGTSLANEEVIDGKSERGGFPVLRKPLKQWMFRITAYADRLLAGLKDVGGVDWPESTKTLQREWIGRSEGAEVDFPVDPRIRLSNFDAITVYTTRPDTIFGATYMVVAPEHDIVKAVLGSGTAGTHEPELRRYVEWAKNRSDVERMESKDKTGAFTGIHAVNPATGMPIPVWVADYVLTGYGTGAIMAVPGQDQRDWDFATKFNLPIVRTVQPPAGWDESKPYVGEGPAINSVNSDLSLDGLNVTAAKAKIIEWLEAKGRGTRKVNFKLRDWVFSRQRYWGEPFPIVYDDAGNHYPVSDAALPVKLPPLADFHPIESDEPKPLLAKATDWLKTTAGAAGVSPNLLDPATPVTRETNTMPGWAGSCWYFLRYCDPKNPGRFVGEDAEQYWMGDNGVDLYIGGAEHAVLHLLYARFWHAVLFDLGHVSTSEPFKKLFHQGLITSFAYQRPDKSFVPNDQVEHREQPDGSVKHSETATGKEVAQVIAKMSKSLKNVFNPDDVIAEFGADTFRLYEMYMGPLEASKPWNPRDIAGCFRFVQRSWRVCIDERTGALKAASGPEDPQLERLLHRTIAKVGADIERLAFNTAIAAMIEFVNAATGAGSAKDVGGGGTGAVPVLTLGQIERFACMLAPFTPHVAEELWKRVGEAKGGTAARGFVVDARGFVVDARWPGVDPAMLEDDTVEIPVQVLGKVRHKITVSPKADAAAIEAVARADEKVRALLADKPVKKVIVVPGKLINFVTG